MSMTSKERVQAALEFRQPDHIPCGFYAIDYDTVERLIGHETFVRNKARTRAALWEGRRDEVVQSYIEDSIALFHKLDDVLDLINLFSELYPVLPPRGWRDPDPPRRVDDVTWVDAQGRIYKYSDMTADITMVEDPHKYTREFKPEDFTLEYAPAPEDETIYEAVDAIVKEFGARKYIVGPAPFARELILLGGFERGLMEMAANPELVDRAVASERAAARARQAGWRNRGYEALLTGEDFAYNSGPFMSLPMFRRFCYPLVADNVRFSHEHGLKFIHHACGNNWKLLDSFMEAGIDCYQSVQATAGMDLAKVKAYTQGRIAVWGGVRLEYLMSGTPAEVRQNVRQELEIGAPGGGYIFGTSHSIAVGCKYDNVMAMLDEFVKRR